MHSVSQQRCAQGIVREEGKTIFILVKKEIIISVMCEEGEMERTLKTYSSVNKKKANIKK